ncbi:MAG: ribosomal RNA small subunit methyltransferase A [Deltaproteobacteria bacterium]|nr:ribosomal RNA small subunit methyltransferase A [Deltaproteobacteria bacterium]MBN2670873.1 ribosomal RNA small subunit methyltransferase A [Deltaproteobacteria bacterium]
MNEIFRFEHPRTVLNRYGLAAKKSWGQNFLVSEKAVRTIAEACAVDDAPVLEIGGGLGTLTQALLHFVSQVTVIEQDRDMCEVLRTEFGNRPNFSLVEGNAAVFNYQQWLQSTGGIIAGNLPYQITGAIIKQVLIASSEMKKSVFMVQKEVADRLCAPVSDHNRGALSVMVSARCHVKNILRLKPTAFFPPPKVRSSVVTLVPREDSVLKEVPGLAFDKVVKAAFATRRKTIKNSLSGALCEKDAADRILQVAGISPSLRAQDIHVQQFAALTRAAIDEQLVEDNR